MITYVIIFAKPTSNFTFQTTHSITTMFISPYSIPIWINVIFIVSMAAVIFFGSKKFSSHAFAFSMLVIAAYTAAVGYVLFSTDYTVQITGLKIIFFSGATSIASLLYFIDSFRRDRPAGKGLTFLLIVILGIFFYLTFYTSNVAGLPIANKLSATGIMWGWSYGWLALAYLSYTIICYIASITLLIKTYKSRSDKDEKRHVLVLITGFLVGALATLIFNSIFPQLNMFDYAWIGPSSGIIWVSIIGYSIVRYHQMNVRVITTEILMVFMAILAFINIFVSDMLGLSGRVSVFAVFIALGAWIIRGALRETEQSNMLKDLNANLEKKVEGQTSELRKSYEIERNAHLELEKIDETKNQFIMITQHHLRTPITSIKWQLEALLNETYGPVSPEIKKAMSDMSESVERLNHLINSLLSISALKSGIETLTKSATNMTKMVSDVVNELHKEIERKKVTVTISPEHQPWPMLSIDKDRMQEVVFIIIENAVKYNIDNGYITISGNADERLFTLTVENTGTELSSDDKKKIFTELFYRSSQAQLAHPTGMGIGLSMAQAIIEAHGGSISIASRKQGGGVKVTVTLPY